MKKKVNHHLMVDFFILAVYYVHIESEKPIMTKKQRLLNQVASSVPIANSKLVTELSKLSADALHELSISLITASMNKDDRKSFINSCGFELA